MFHILCNIVNNADQQDSEIKKQPKILVKT